MYWINLTEGENLVNKLGNLINIRMVKFEKGKWNVKIKQSN